MEQTNSKYILIQTQNIFPAKILTWQYSSKEEAIVNMQERFRVILAKDEPTEAENLMALLKDGVELSNAALTENSAHIYHKNGQSYHFWKIIEIL